MNYRIRAWWNRFSHNWKLIGSYVLGTKPPVFNPVGSYSVVEAKNLGLISRLDHLEYAREPDPVATKEATLFTIPSDYKVERRDSEDPSILDVINMSRSITTPVHEAAGPVADKQSRVEKETSNDIPDQAGSCSSHPRGD